MPDYTEAQCPQPTANMLGGAVMECAKEEARPDISRIEHNSPENQVVLSRRLEQLVRRVGGCQTDEVMALVRRIMFELISQHSSPA